MLVLYFAISPDAIRYGQTQGTKGAQFWPYTIRFTNVKPAPPTIAGTIFVINNEINTNGENVKNNSTLAYRSCAKLSTNSFNVNPSRPATKPNTSVDMLVTTVKITIQTKNMTYLLARNFVWILELSALSLECVHCIPCQTDKK